MEAVPSGMHRLVSNMLNGKWQRGRSNIGSEVHWAGGDGDTGQKLCDRVFGS